MKSERGPAAEARLSAARQACASTNKPPTGRLVRFWRRIRPVLRAAGRDLLH